MSPIEMVKIKKTWFHKGWVVISLILGFFSLILSSIESVPTITPLVLLLQIPIYFIVLVLHESIHIMWKMVFKYTGRLVTIKNGKSKIITFIVNEPIKYKHFLIIVASPFIVINIAYLFCLPYSWSIYLFLAVFLNNLGCYIDVYLITRALKHKPTTITVNNGIVTFNK